MPSEKPRGLPEEEDLQVLLDFHRENLTKMRAALGDVLNSSHDDHWLVRFLNGTTLDKAVTRFRAMLQWRKEHNADEIARKIENGLRPKDFPYFDIVVKYFPQAAFVNYSKCGRPLTIEMYGAADVAGLLNNLTAEKYYLYHVHRMEFVRLFLSRIARETGRYRKVMVLADLHALGMRHINISFINVLKSVSAFSEDHYREQVGKVFVLNTNVTFSTIWRMVKPVLNENTLRKISLCSRNQSEKLLFAHVDADVLPKRIGGNLPDDVCFAGDIECNPATVVGPVPASARAQLPIPAAPALKLLVTPPGSGYATPSARGRSTSDLSLGVPHDPADDGKGVMASFATDDPHGTMASAASITINVEDESDLGSPTRTMPSPRAASTSREPGSISSSTYRLDSSSFRGSSSRQHRGATRFSVSSTHHLDPYAHGRRGRKRSTANSLASFGSTDWETASEGSEDDLGDSDSLVIDGTLGGPQMTTTLNAIARARRDSSTRRIGRIGNQTRKAMMIWFIAAMIMHIVFDGIVLLVWALGINRDSRIFILSSAIYADYDQRYDTPDALIVTLQFMSVFILGPLSGLCAYGLYRRRSWWALVSSITCFAEVYGRIIAITTNAQTFGRIFDSESLDDVRFIGIFVPWTVIGILVPLFLLVLAVRAARFQLRARDRAYLNQLHSHNRRATMAAMPDELGKSRGASMRV